MKSQLHYIVGKGAKLLLPLLLINSAFADSTSDARIQAYKANKLLSSEVILPTSTGAKDSDEVVVFNSKGLVWNSDNAGTIALYPLLAKYGDMTLDEIKLAMGPEGTFDEDIWWCQNLAGWVKSQMMFKKYVSFFQLWQMENYNQKN